MLNQTETMKYTNMVVDIFLIQATEFIWGILSVATLQLMKQRDIIHK